MRRRNVDRPLLVGLTGGLGAGKSTVLAYFRACGAATFDADAEVRRLLTRDAGIRRQLINKFGSGIRDARGQLDRRLIASRVFGKPADRRWLERQLHPRVRSAMEKWHRATTRRVHVADIPLLFEAGWVGRFDRVVCVTAPRALRVRRLVARGMPRSEARRRMAAQWSQVRKASKSDFVVRNDASLAKTEKQVTNLWRTLRQLTQGVPWNRTSRINQPN